MRWVVDVVDVDVDCALIGVNFESQALLAGFQRRPVKRVFGGGFWGV